MKEIFFGVQKNLNPSLKDYGWINYMDSIVPPQGWFGECHIQALDSFTVKLIRTNKPKLFRFW